MEIAAFFGGSRSDGDISLKRVGTVTRLRWSSRVLDRIRVMLVWIRGSYEEKRSKPSRCFSRNSMILRCFGNKWDFGYPFLFPWVFVSDDSLLICLFWIGMKYRVFFCCGACDGSWWKPNLFTISRPFVLFCFLEDSFGFYICPVFVTVTV